MFLQIPNVAPQLPDIVPPVKEELAMLKTLPLDELINRLVSSVVTFAINLAIAIIVFYVGRMIINRIYKLISSIFIRRRIDRSLATFVLSMLRMVLYFILVVTVIGILGIETSSFIALFASAGVAIGMALSGTLQNFAGGVLILLMKPYKIGDYIEAQGFAGYVREIQIFHTIICTSDNKSIIIPNGGLSTGSVNNWSREDYRRVDWMVSISYGDDVEAARQCILGILASDERIVTKYVEDDRRRRAEENPPAVEADVEERPKSFWRRIFSRHHKRLKALDTPVEPVVQLMTAPVDRSPVVRLSQLGESSVDLKVMAWTNTPDYWSVYYTINERIYNELPKVGINFPFPQLDLHIIKPAASATAGADGTQSPLNS